MVVIQESTMVNLLRGHMDGSGTESMRYIKASIDTMKISVDICKSY